MGAQRLAQRFRQLREQKRVGVIPFLTIGFPDVEATLELVPELEAAGAAVIELGIPFSDPLADGVTIQASSYQALEQGITLRKCLETCAKLRQNGVECPLVLMGYYNCILSYGLAQTSKHAAEAGVDGFIVVDLPAEEAGPFQAACRAQGLCFIPMVAPTSTEDRIMNACLGAEGFVYCVSVTGVTGVREELPVEVPEFIARVRRHTNLPLAVGFGVSQRVQVELVGTYAEAAVVGSALIRTIATTPRQELWRVVRRFVSDLAGTLELSDRG
jgi:tryptophan synthase alpha chain